MLQLLNSIAIGPKTISRFKCKQHFFDTFVLETGVVQSASLVKVKSEPKSDPPKYGSTNVSVHLLYA